MEYLIDPEEVTKLDVTPCTFFCRIKPMYGVPPIPY
jgi:hypothetical protein